MALTSPVNDTMQEQLMRLYAMSQALRQQSGFGAQPMQMGMRQPSQYRPGNIMPMQPPQMPQQQPQGGMTDNMMNMLPMMMMMMGGGSPSLGRVGGMQPGMVGTIPGIY